MRVERNLAKNNGTWYEQGEDYWCICPENQ